MKTNSETIRQFMTLMPHTIGPEQTLESAHAMMRARHIRHLPVLHGGKLVGIISERELAVIEALPEMQTEKLKNLIRVEEAMEPDPYLARPDDELADVVSAMESRKIGSAVIMDHDDVVGIFTTTDALRVLASILKSPERSDRMHPTLVPATTP